MSMFRFIAMRKSAAERGARKNTLLFGLSALLLCATAPALAQTSSPTTTAPAVAQTSSPTKGHDYRFCSGYYALCAASTCKPTGNTIKVRVTNGGFAYFPEVDCTCPVFSGRGLGDLNGGNMNGSCEPPGEGQIWSLFAPKTHIAQEINNWVPTGPKADAPPQVCPVRIGQGDMLSNCFSFACDHEDWTKNVPVVTCHCPMGESFDGTQVKKYTAFATQAGQGDQNACYDHPVSVPIGPGFGLD